MEHCSMCNRFTFQGGNIEACCVFEKERVPKWAAESKHARAACWKMRNGGINMPEARDLYEEEAMHEDRVEMSQAEYEAEIEKHRQYQGEFNSPTIKEAVAKEAAKMRAEVDEDGLNQHTPGAKLDQGKVDIYRHFMAMFPDAMACVAWVSEYGERKYSYMGWAHVNEGKRRYTAALSRHLLDEARGEVYDTNPEKGSDLAHAAQAAWNAMARLQLMIEDDEVEMRRGREL